MIITAVKDIKSEIFLQPQFQRSMADAMRNWEIVANEGDSLVSRFPNDFVLYQLGEYTEDGTVLALPKPKSLASAAEMKRKPENTLPFDKTSTLNSKRNHKK